VHVDGDVAVEEVLQPTGVVEMQVADYHGGDVGDAIPGGLDRGGEFVRVGVFGSGKDVC
jgi:hypothetical protein